MKTILCPIEINGKRQSVMPLELIIDGEAYLAVLNRDISIPLDKTLVTEPKDGLATWNYAGVLLFQTVSDGKLVFLCLKSKLTAHTARSISSAMKAMGVNKSIVRSVSRLSLFRRCYRPNPACKSRPAKRRRIWLILTANNLGHLPSRN
jgi:hypothetical protein